MKKLTLLSLLVAFMASFAVASNSNNYKINDQSVDAMFAQATEVTNFATLDLTSSYAKNELGITAGEEPTKTGFLIRAFFCGNFALHRSYMGTKGLFIKYFCTFGVVSCVDFWGTVIKGDEFFNKFKGNDKFVVWSKDKK